MVLQEFYLGKLACMGGGVRGGYVTMLKALFKSHGYISKNLKMFFSKLRQLLNILQNQKNAIKHLLHIRKYKGND